MVIFTPDKRHVDMEQSFDLSPELAKQARYEAFLPRLAALIEGIDDEVAVLANTAAALREAFGFFWVGFYRAEGEELRLGPFQGTVACYRIRKGRGVCGTAFAEGRSIVVADVEQFPGHIACKAYSTTDDHVVIQVSNDGPAIPEAERAHVFTPFFTTKRQSSGLGLSVCRQIMTASHGTISLSPTGTQGWNTTFVLDFA